MQSSIPIVVDLDDTLARTDFFYESLLKFIKLNPLNFFRAVIWLMTKGKAHLKSKIAETVTLDVSLIPYNEKVISYIETKKQHNHPIILATATHRVFAQAVANHLNLFDQVFATDARENLKGDNKEKKLIKTFGERGFVYVGDSYADLKVWRSAKSAVVVAPTDKLMSQVQVVAQIEQVIPTNGDKPSISQILYSFDWLKTLLLFLPLFVLGYWDNTQIWIKMCFAIASMCMIAVSINTFAELFNLDTIRRDKNLRNRVYADGQLGITNGIGLALFCLVGSAALSLIISVDFLILVSIYFIFLSGYFIYFQAIVPKSLIYSFSIAVHIFAGYLVILIN